MTRAAESTGMDSSESQRHGRCAPLLGWLIHPATVAAVVLLAVNDHLLKAHYPGLLTGKLSDLAGLVVLPPLLALALVPVLRRPAVAARTALVVTAACFTVVKATPTGAHVASTAWSLVSGPSVVLADPTDLVALPAVGVATWAWTRALRRPPSAARLRRIEVLVVLPAAAVALAATTAPHSPEAVAVGTWRGMIVVGEANVFDGDRQPEDWRLSHDGRVWRPMRPSEVSAFEAERVGRDFMARQDCVPEDEDRCYRIEPGHLRVLESADGGASWSTSWQVPDGRRMYLARQHRVLSAGDVVARLSAQAVAVLPTAGHRHLVVVANGPDGYAVRNASGRWERIGFGVAAGGYESPAEPLNGGFSVILPEILLAVLVGLLVLGVAGWRLSVAAGRAVTGSSRCLFAGLLVGVAGAAWLTSPQVSVLNLAQLPAVLLGLGLTVIGVGGLIGPGMGARAGRRRLAVVLLVALGTTGGIVALFWAWSEGLLVDYRAAAIMAVVVALAGTALGGRLIGPATAEGGPAQVRTPALPPADPTPAAPAVAAPGPELAGPSPPGTPPRSRLRPAKPPDGGGDT